jgi:hypothetical protein
VPRRPFAEFRASVNAEPEGPSMGLRSHASRARGTTCLPGPADPDLGSSGSSSESLQLDARLTQRFETAFRADSRRTTSRAVMSWGDRTGPRRAPSSRGVPGTPASGRSGPASLTPQTCGHRIARLPDLSEVAFTLDTAKGDLKSGSPAAAFGVRSPGTMLSRPAT